MTPTLLQMSAALRDRLASAATTAGVAAGNVEWDNAEFEPPDDSTTPWLSTILQLDARDQVEAHVGGAHRQEGALRVLVHVPAGGGDGGGLTISQTIIDAFSANQDLTAGAGYVRLGTPYPGSLGRERGWFVSVVTCPFHSTVIQ